VEGKIVVYSINEATQKVSGNREGEARQWHEAILKSIK